MGQTTPRLLAMLELLQSRRRINGSELAECLQVDRRTVRRYIAALENLGIPITSERGPDGAYMLVAGYKLPPLMFNNDEALALSVGLIAARELGLGKTTTGVVTAQAKLERVLPANLRRRARAVDESVKLDLAGSSVRTLDPAAFAELSTAAQQQQRVQLTYCPPGVAPTTREFDPYGLAYHLSRWYVAGMCHLRRDLRTFRVDRIQSVSAVDRFFERPPNFPVMRHVQQAIAKLPRTHSVTVLLRTDLPNAQRAILPSIGTLEAAPGDGGVLMRSQADDLDWMARELARLPFAFEIVDPPELRHAVRELAERLSASARIGASRRRRQRST